MGFPEGFLWGAAAAGFQVEGAAREDGKGPSIWDMACRWPGKILNGDQLEPANDHYHRFCEDADLFAGIGLKAYRSSISWPRVIPEGTGKVNERGLDFYDRLVDALLERGIQPWMGLYHWELPYALHLRGGWLNRQIADWMADFAAVAVDRLSDRITYWETINEPQVFIGQGYWQGGIPPFLTLDVTEARLAAHHVLLAHGRTAQVIRARARRQPCIGAALVGEIGIPATTGAADVEAARAYAFSLREDEGKLFKNTWFADPIFLGRYPEDGLRLHSGKMPPIPAGDMEVVCQPLDYYGVNLYSGVHVRAAADGGYEILPRVTGAPCAGMGYHLTPEILYWGPRFLFERYGLPIVVTENGIDLNDWIHLDGRVHDPQRIEYLARHLKELGRAIDNGVAAKGYFVWTTMDNFECTVGYRPRMGLIHVDFATQRRTLKDSAYWYKEIIAANGAGL